MIISNTIINHVLNIYKSIKLATIDDITDNFSKFNHKLLELGFNEDRMILLSDIAQLEKETKLMWIIKLFHDIDVKAKQLNIDIKCKQVQSIFYSDKFIRGHFVRKLDDARVKLYSCYNSEDGVERAWLEYEGDESTVSYIAQSASITPLVNNLNVLHVFDAWEEDGDSGIPTSLVCISEFISESTLMFLNTVKGININVLKKWICQLVDVVYSLHYGTSITNPTIPSLLHRDISCENVYVEKSTGSIRLGGFGYSTSINRIPINEEIQPNLYYSNKYRNDYKDDIKACGITILRWCLQTKDLIPCCKPETIRNDEILEYLKEENRENMINQMTDEPLKDFLTLCLLKITDDYPTAEDLLNHPMIQQFPQFSELCEKTTLEGLKQHKELIPIKKNLDIDNNTHLNINFEKRVIQNNIYNISFQVPSNRGYFKFSFDYNTNKDTPDGIIQELKNCKNELDRMQIPNSLQFSDSIYDLLYKSLLSMLSNNDERQI